MNSHLKNHGTSRNCKIPYTTPVKIVELSEFIKSNVMQLYIVIYCLNGLEIILVVLNSLIFVSNGVSFIYLHIVPLQSKL